MAINEGYLTANVDRKEFNTNNKADIFNTDNTYDLILADPPWKQAKGGKKNVRPMSSGTYLDYPTCSLDEIKSHLSQATNLCSENSILFL